VIESFHVQGFRCLKDTELALTPLHALIGPNDSGKSTLLKALLRANMGGLGPGGLFTMRVDGQGAARLDGGRHFNGRHFDSYSVPLNCRALRIKPDRAREGHALLAAPSIEDDGHGLGALYDYILSEDRTAFDAIEATVREAFPTVDRLWLPVVEKGKAIGVTLVDGTKVGPNELSEGLLYWLVYKGLDHVRPVDLLLVEEPENGLHPARIADVMAVLRRLSEKGTQVVVATHSPLVVNELRPEEVSIVSRTVRRGTKAHLMSSIPNVEELLETYALGELWVTFADGDSDRFLFEPSSAAS